MRNVTRLAFTALAAQIALLNGVASATEKFNVAPSVQQTLETAMQESSAFLKAINLIGVNEQTGEALLAGVNGPIASRTNTAAGNRRNPADVSQLTKDVYACKQTNFDTAFPYALLDAWAKFPDFQVRLTNAIIERQSLDRIMIGFNGTSAALATDRANNPLLQDVNKGWLQKIREGAADHVMDEGAVAGKVTVGGTKVIKVAGVDTGIGGDYPTWISVNPWIPVWILAGFDPLQPFEVSAKPGTIQINHSSLGNSLLIRDNLKPATCQDSREL